MEQSKGAWTDVEVNQLRDVVTDGEEDGTPLFDYESSWNIRSLESNPDRSLVNIKLSRAKDRKRLTLILRANEGDNELPLPNGSALTNRVFAFSFLLLEFTGVIDLNGFQDGHTVELSIGCDIYSLAPE
jgi:hypothetical protein